MSAEDWSDPNLGTIHTVKAKDPMRRYIQHMTEIYEKKKGKVKTIPIKVGRATEQSLFKVWGTLSAKVIGRIKVAMDSGATNVDEIATKLKLSRLDIVYACDLMVKKGEAVKLGADEYELI